MPDVAPRIHIPVVFGGTGAFATVTKLEHDRTPFRTQLARDLLEHPTDQLTTGSNLGASSEGIPMRVAIKIPRELYDLVLSDLRRPHEFAYERVGFLSAKLGNRSGEHPLVLLSSYQPVPDNQYIKDPDSGARINSAAIRSAMQRVLDNGEGAFHVHLHEHRGRPEFGRMDSVEIPLVISGLRIAGPSAPHGMLLLSSNHGTGWVWLPGLPNRVTAYRISVVGFPLVLLDQE